MWTNVLAGIALAGAALRESIGSAGTAGTSAPPASLGIVGIAIPPASLALLLVAMSLFYTGGMFLNDAFDREIDAKERPERPIPSGAVPAQFVYGIGYGMLALGWALVCAHTLATGAGMGAPIAGAALEGAIVAYNMWHKGNPWSPVLMGLCRALVYATVALAVTDALAPAVVAGAGVVWAYVIGLTYMAKQETLGRIAHLWPLLFLAAPFVYGAPVLAAGGAGAVLYFALLAWVVGALTLLRGPAPAVGTAVARLIAGIALVDALAIARAGDANLALTAALGLPLTLFLQRYVRGT